MPLLSKIRGLPRSSCYYLGLTFCKSPSKSILSSSMI